MRTRLLSHARAAAAITLIAVLVFEPTLLTAQALEKAPPPLTLEFASETSATGVVLPAGGKALLHVVPGSGVRMTGSSMPMSPTAKEIRFEVKKPTGAPVKLAATLDPTNKFSTLFKDTAATGSYTVTASSADGSVTATGTFVVATAEDIGDLVDALIDALEEANAEAAKAAEAAQAAIAGKGSFDGDAKVKQAMTEVAAAIKAFPAELSKARAGLSQLSGVAKKYPGGVKHLAPIIDELNHGIQVATQAGDGMRKATAELSRNSGLCDRIDAVAEVLGAMSLYFDLCGRLFAKVVQLATDKYLPDKIYNDAIPIDKRNAVEKFNLGESMKAVGSALSGAKEGGAAGASGGLIEFVKKPQNLLLDTAQLLTGLAFDKLCERIQGPVTGTFRVDATINKSKFWGYQNAINGKLMLRYQKSQVKPGMAVEVTGEIEGNGDIQAYENLMAFNPFNEKFVVFRHLFQPPGMGAAGQAATDPLGKIARYATPAYFRIPVKGKLQGDNLEITIGDTAMVDFSSQIKGRAYYLMIAPPVLPYLLASDIPIEKAQFVISRGLRTTATMPLTSTTKGKQVFKIGDQTFTRKEVVSNGEVTVTWNLRVKACNPECP
ncbi:MAG TPA: hypothetical protein VNJ02_03170 [Vicinamibacterales bacterium]|nr:hypothetical protein [Vicinamibacterales bacterium]